MSISSPQASSDPAPHEAIADRRFSIRATLGAALILVLPLIGLVVARGLPCSNHGLDCLTVFIGGGVLGPAVGLAIGLAVGLPLGAQRAGLVAPALVGAVLAVALAGQVTAGVPVIVAALLAAGVARLAGGAWRRPATVPALVLVVVGVLLGVAVPAALSAVFVTIHNSNAQHRLEASGLPLYAPADRTGLTLMLSTMDPNDPSPLTVIAYLVDDRAAGKSYVVRISGAATAPACEQSRRERVGDWLVGPDAQGAPAACRGDGTAVLWVTSEEGSAATRDDVLGLAQDLRRVDAAWLLAHALT